MSFMAFRFPPESEILKFVVAIVQVDTRQNGVDSNVIIKLQDGNSAVSTRHRQFYPVKKPDFSIV